MPNTNSPALDLPQLLARSERPFPPSPQVARYFPATATEEARKRLARAIERGDGPGLVIGAAGTGKSLLLQVLAAQYHDRFDVVLLACARICTRRALLQAILFELGLPYRSRDEGALRLSLLDQLLSGEPSSVGLLLLVDEAQSLSAALLDELRVLTNIVRGGVPRVRVVLAGSPALEESFANPELESFNQRLAARTYLAGFNRQETAQYIRAQIAASGGSPDQIFDTASLNAIFDATDGAPRLVNQLCDRALLFAEENCYRQITSQIVQSAWSDLQQLPSAWVAPITAAVQTTSPAIEFGSLDDYNSSEATAIGVELLDCDPTELDIEEVSGDYVPRKESSFSTIATEKRDDRFPPSGSDPFAEEFDEEEIVLDNFAAWDEVICGHSPRVENLRDGRFASRVRDAMLAVDQTLPQVSAEHETAVTRDGDDNDCHLTDEETREIEKPSDNSAANWPPIRLAVVGDSPRLTPIPLITPLEGVATTGAAAFDPVLPEYEATSTELAPIALWRRTAGDALTAAAPAARNAPSPSTWSRETLRGARYSISDEDPILVIEADDDQSRRSPPPVRRESYRNIFSRLRSG